MASIWNCKKKKKKKFNQHSFNQTQLSQQFLAKMMRIIIEVQGLRYGSKFLF